jgi:hypothetical protein
MAQRKRAARPAGASGTCFAVKRRSRPKTTLYGEAIRTPGRQARRDITLELEQGGRNKMRLPWAAFAFSLARPQGAL